MDENSLKVVADAATDEEQINASLRKALRGTAFSNRMLISPRRLDELGREETRNFYAFLDALDTASVTERGRQMALDGLGQASVLSLCSALRQTWLAVCQTSSNGLPKAIGAAENYTTALLLGYMQGREEELRQEQERTRNAYLRTLEQQPSLD
jgi:hypothetical protein